MPRQDTLTAAVAAAGAGGAATTEIPKGSFKRGDTAIFRAPMVFMNDRTGERFLVTAVTGDKITILRKYGERSKLINNANTAMKIGDLIRRIAVAQNETGVAGPAQTQRIGHRNNIVQYFTATADLSELGEKISILGPKAMAHQRRKAKYEYLKDKESAFLWGDFANEQGGVAGITESDLKDWRGTTRGFILTMEGATDANILDTRVLSWNKLCDFTEEINRNRTMNGTTLRTTKAKPKKDMGDMNLVAICGKKASIALGNMQRNQHITIVPEQPNWGFNLKTVQTPFGMLDLYYHTLLDGVYSNYILLVDRERVGTRFLSGFDVATWDISERGYHGTKEEIYSLEGFFMTNPECHGIIKGIETAE